MYRHANGRLGTSTNHLCADTHDLGAVPSTLAEVADHDAGTIDDAGIDDGLMDVDLAAGTSDSGKNDGGSKQKNGNVAPVRMIVYCLTDTYSFHF